MSLKHFLLGVLACAILISSYSFCGFFVAKAGAELFNKASSVIMVRDGQKTTITMNNDFQGDVKDFAMVIPVPVVLKRNQIKLGDQSLFQFLDAYSAPRLAMYYDESPCIGTARTMYEATYIDGQSVSVAGTRSVKRKLSSVKIEAEYQVGEYDILVLSSKDSDDLKTWLVENGYKLPAKAEEVLKPYILSKMKFFVVKVNLEKQKELGVINLRPLKISFETPKFMLPIRLGMANAKEYQDLIIYALTRHGRVECSNYKNNKIPTDFEIPLFVNSSFGSFYKALFDNTWAKKKNAVYLEYAWDLSSTNPVKCDPCVGTPPEYEQLTKAGVDWLKLTPSQFGGNTFDGQAFITRMHVRYDRENFPQDLVFVETPNQEKFQGRYVIHTPAHVPSNCDEAYNYYQKVYERRLAELDNYKKYTESTVAQNYEYANEYKKLMDSEENRLIKEGKSDKIKKGGFGNNYLTKRGLAISIILLLIVGAYKLSLRNKVS